MVEHRDRDFVAMLVVANDVHIRSKHFVHQGNGLRIFLAELEQAAENRASKGIECQVAAFANKLRNDSSYDFCAKIMDKLQKQVVCMRAAGSFSESAPQLHNQTPQLSRAGKFKSLMDQLAPLTVEDELANQVENRGHGGLDCRTAECQCCLKLRHQVDATSGRHVELGSGLAVVQNQISFSSAECLFGLGPRAPHRRWRKGLNTHLTNEGVLDH
mmetsp:Transcript_13133/g.35974  ORF Transcript_13133/g.35974 Transcript_13133/m.35974 type:complete len:215 (-) Transcript_13133:75-719(-)